jgi:hypothetical protein
LHPRDLERNRINNVLAEVLPADSALLGKIDLWQFMRRNSQNSFPQTTLPGAIPTNRFNFAGTFGQ